MKSTTKVLSLALLTLSVSGAGVGQSFGQTGKEVVASPDAKIEYEGTLSILTKFGLEQLSPYFFDVAQEYEKLHPKVNIELIQESDDSVKGKTKSLVASNSMPDIYFSWTGSWGANFVRGKRAVDLTEIIGPDSEWGRSFAPAAVAAFQYNGKYYGIPLYLNAKFMGYNKRIFSELGLQEPDTFEDLINSCNVIRDSGQTPISFGNKEGWPAVHYAGQLLAYNVDKATLEKDFDTQTAEYSDPGYMKALEQLKQLVDRCTGGSATNGTSYASALQMFINAQSAMYYQEIIEFDQSVKTDSALQQKEFGYFVLPAPKNAKGDPKAIEGAPEGYLINTASENIPLAIDFMKFATSPKNASVLSAPPYGQPSATINGISGDTMNPAVIGGLQDIASASYMMPWLDTANTPRVASAWLSGLQALIGGSMTSEEVIDRVRNAAHADR